MIAQGSLHVTCTVGAGALWLGWLGFGKPREQRNGCFEFLQNLSAGGTLGQVGFDPKVTVSAQRLLQEVGETRFHLCAIDSLFRHHASRL